MTRPSSGAESSEPLPFDLSEVASLQVKGLFLLGLGHRLQPALGAAPEAEPLLARLDSGCHVDHDIRREISRAQVRRR